MALRTALRLVLASRKLALTVDDNSRIDGWSDTLTLRRWLQNAATASTPAEVFAV